MTEEIEFPLTDKKPQIITNLLLIKAIAQSNYCFILLKGKGVEQNKEEALQFLTNSLNTAS